MRTLLTFFLGLCFATTVQAQPHGMEVCGKEFSVPDDLALDESMAGVQFAVEFDDNSLVDPRTTKLVVRREDNGSHVIKYLDNSSAITDEELGTVSNAFGELAESGFTESEIVCSHCLSVVLVAGGDWFRPVGACEPETGFRAVFEPAARLLDIAAEAFPESAEYFTTLSERGRNSQTLAETIEQIEAGAKDQ